MAKEKKKEVSESVISESEDMPVSEKPTKQKSESVILISFDRYFSTLGKPSHHKAGMSAFVNTRGKKTIQAWDTLFKGY